jgi:hypothetical protein
MLSIVSNTFDSSAKVPIEHHSTIVNKSPVESLNESPVESFGGGESDWIHDDIGGDMSLEVIFCKECTSFTSPSNNSVKNCT